MFKNGPALLRFTWRHPANEGRRVSTLLRAALFQLRGRLLGRSTIIRCGEHSRIFAYPGVHGSSAAVYANPPDLSEMLAWRRHLKIGDLFVDIGANVGFYTIWAIDCGARVIAVEPNHEAVRRLQQNLALNGYHAAIRPLALADHQGSMVMTTDLDTSDHVISGAAAHVGTTSTVQVTTLDELLGKDIAHGVKVDVEGAERLVLEGASKALRDHRIRLLQIEWNSRSIDFLGEDRSRVAALLHSFDYQLYRPSDRGELVGVVAPTVGADVFAAPSS